MIDPALVPAVFDSLLSGLDVWRRRSAKNQQERIARDEAIGTVLKAVIETKAYLYDQSESRRPNRKRERKLALAWQRAAEAIRLYDQQLFQISGVKALGWADPNEWERTSVSPTKLKLDTIIEQCKYLQRET